MSTLEKYDSMSLTEFEDEDKYPGIVARNTFFFLHQTISFRFFLVFTLRSTITLFLQQFTQYILSNKKLFSSQVRRNKRTQKKNSRCPLFELSSPPRPSPLCKPLRRGTLSCLRVWTRFSPLLPPVASTMLEPLPL